MTRYQINKIDRMAGLAFQNALRLHFDAIRLYKIPSYASALALSVLSMEELAKAWALEDIGWHALVDKSTIDEQWKYLQKDFYDHKSKQIRFVSRNMASLVHTKAILAVFSSKESAMLTTCENAYRKAVQEQAEPEEIEKIKGKLEKAESMFHDAYIKALPTSSLWKKAATGELEKVKQKAFYVGIAGKSPISQGSRIQNPLTISSKRPAQYITFVNDFLLDLTIGELGGWYGVDADSIRQQLTRSLVHHLNRSWPKHGRIGKRALRLCPRIEIDED